MLLTVPLVGLQAGEEAKPAVSAKALEEVGKRIGELRAPITILSTDMYRDGGTLSFTLGDAAGKQLVFCMDGRGSSGTEDSLFVGAPHPSKEEALRLPSGSEEESALLEILKALVAGKVANGERLPGVIAKVAARREIAKKGAALGPLTDQQAIEIARMAVKASLGNLVDLGGKVTTADKGAFIEVRFFDPKPLAAAGDTLGTEVMVAKETRQALEIGRFERDE
jgi:hypothetical protein